MAPIYRPSKVKLHDTTLANFIHLFNSSQPQFIVAKKELADFIRDATIRIGGETIGIDWELRDDWKSGHFPFKTLAQFERKFDPPKGIELTIQSRGDLQYFVAAWHKNFSLPVGVDRKTDYTWDEEGKMRTTTQYKEFSQAEMTNFKCWLITLPVCDYATAPVPKWKNCLPCPLYKDGHCMSKGGRLQRAIEELQEGKD